MQKIVLVCLLMMLHIGSKAQSDPHNTNPITEQLENIGNQPKKIIIQNTIPLHTQGGHIQGIQVLEYQNKPYYFLSGSTDKHSYYSIAGINEENKFITHRMILEKPFKHAGGFQFYDKLMAVGIEDNDGKKRSKVFVYLIENPEVPPEKPLAIVERYGTARRGTAGCVAITETENKVIIIVGDWDTENLDFYVINRELLGVDPSALILEYSLKSTAIDRSNWIDAEWMPYQNINLIKDGSAGLWLAGMASNQKDENIIDLYKVENENFKSFSLQKVYRRNFGQNPEGLFRWGAGIYTDRNGIQILATPENIEEQTTIQIYE
jgi:hypothetical protein